MGRPQSVQGCEKRRDTMDPSHTGHAHCINRETYSHCCAYCAHNGRYQHLSEDTTLGPILKYGFPIGFLGTVAPTIHVPNHSSAVARFWGQSSSYGCPRPLASRQDSRVRTRMQPVQGRPEPRLQAAQVRPHAGYRLAARDFRGYRYPLRSTAQRVSVPTRRQ